LPPACDCVAARCRHASVAQAIARTGRRRGETCAQAMAARARHGVGHARKGGRGLAGDGVLGCTLTRRAGIGAGAGARERAGVVGCVCVCVWCAQNSPPRRRGTLLAMRGVVLNAESGEFVVRWNAHRRGLFMCLPRKKIALDACIVLQSDRAV
jgi:hypothetical protein